MRSESSFSMELTTWSRHVLCTVSRAAGTAAEALRIRELAELTSEQSVPIRIFTYSLDPATLPSPQRVLLRRPGRRPGEHEHAARLGRLLAT